MVNVEIMRAFVKLRRMRAPNAALSRRFDELESKYDRQFKVVFDAIPSTDVATTPRSQTNRLSRPVREEGHLTLLHCFTASLLHCFTAHRPLLTAHWLCRKHRKPHQSPVFPYASRWQNPIH